MTAIPTTDQRLDQVALQMQDMMTMIGRLVSSEIPALHPESLPAGTNAKAQAADWSGLEWESTDQREPWRGPSRLFRRSVGSLSKCLRKCLRKALVHLNYRGPGQRASSKEVLYRPTYRDNKYRSENN